MHADIVALTNDQTSSFCLLPPGKIKNNWFHNLATINPNVNGSVEHHTTQIEEVEYGDTFSLPEKLGSLEYSFESELVTQNRITGINFVT